MTAWIRWSKITEEQRRRHDVAAEFSSFLANHANGPLADRKSIQCDMAAVAEVPSKASAANEARSWTNDDDWLVCACGSFAFNVMKRDDLCHVLCAKCEADHTINVWGA